MKRLLLTFVVLLMGAVLMANAAPLRIIATVPDLADVARHIGGDYVQVESLARGTEDIHSIPQRPSFLPKLNRADAVVLIGLEAEHAFLPALLETAQNPRIQRGQAGYLDCSQGVKPLHVPTDLSRAQGELHPLGNPHYTLDPRQGGTIADNLAAGFSRLDPAHKAAYEKNRDTFKTELAVKIKTWRDIAKPLQGLKVVTHHQDMVYLADFLGLVEVGTVELKPGIPPTPTHLEHLIETMKTEKVAVLIREIQYSTKTAEWIAAQTGAKIAAIATMGGAFPDSQDYFGFIDHNIRAIVEAAKG